MRNFSLEIKWGFIFMIASLIWMFIEKLAGLHDRYIEMHPIYTNLFAIIAVAIFVFALRDKKRQLNGQMSWKQGFLSGVIISLVVALLSPATQYLTFTYITPEYFKNAIDYATSKGRISREAAEMLFNLKSYIIQGAFGAISMGVVTSAIVAAFVKSSNHVKA